MTNRNVTSTLGKLRQIIRVGVSFRPAIVIAAILALQLCALGLCAILTIACEASSTETPNKQSRLTHQLFEAIEVGNATRVAGLLKEGVGVRVTNERGMPPLVFLFSMSPYRGTEKARLEIARLLLKHGADANGLVPLSINESGVRVLEWAILSSRSAEVVRMFLKHGADPKIDGSTSLFTAVMVNEKEIVDLLIDGGADPNDRGPSGQTPLFLVNRLVVAEALVRHGADVNAKNEEGISVLKHLSDPYKACGRCGCIPVNEEVVRYLESKGAK